MENRTSITRMIAQDVIAELALPIAQIAVQSLLKHPAWLRQEINHQREQVSIDSIMTKVASKLSKEVSLQSKSLARQEILKIKQQIEKENELW